MLLMLDIVAGQKTSGLVCRQFARGIISLYPPVGQLWRKMARSLQRILKRRTSDGEYPGGTAQIIARL